MYPLMSVADSKGQNVSLWDKIDWQAPLND